jgi:CHASE2 domain-containing sensor protein
MPWNCLLSRFEMIVTQNGRKGQERMNRRILWALLIETIGTVVFNVGWWMDWPPMVLFSVLLAVTGLDLWDEK